MVAVVHCPRYLKVSNPVAVVSLCNAILKSDTDVQVDVQNLEFVDPFGLAMLGASLAIAKEQGTDVSISGINCAAGAYMERMDVFRDMKLIGPRVQRGRNDMSNVLVELKCLKRPAEVDEIAGHLARAITGRMPGVDPNEKPDEMTCLTQQDRYITPLHYVLSELLENAMTHARLGGYQDANVWVCCQYFLSLDRVQLAVIDNGTGFLGTLGSHPNMKGQRDLTAIQLALQPKISCNRSLGRVDDCVNEGIGLTTAARIVDASGGKTMIISGSGWYNSQGAQIDLPGGQHWQGVAVSMDLQRELLKEVDVQTLFPRSSGSTRRPALRFE